MLLNCSLQHPGKVSPVSQPVPGKHVLTQKHCDFLQKFLCFPEETFKEESAETANLADFDIQTDCPWERTHLKSKKYQCTNASFFF